MMCPTSPDRSYLTDRIAVSFSHLVAADMSRITRTVSCFHAVASADRSSAMRGGRVSRFRSGHLARAWGRTCCRSSALALADLLAFLNLGSDHVPGRRLTDGGVGAEGARVVGERSPAGAGRADDGSQEDGVVAAG